MLYQILTYMYLFCNQNITLKTLLQFALDNNNNNNNNNDFCKKILYEAILAIQIFNKNEIND